MVRDPTLSRACDIQGGPRWTESKADAAGKTRVRIGPGQIRPLCPRQRVRYGDVLYELVESLCLSKRSSLLDAPHLSLALIFQDRYVYDATAMVNHIFFFFIPPQTGKERLDSWSVSHRIAILQLNFSQLQKERSCRPRQTGGAPNPTSWVVAMGAASPLPAPKRKWCMKKKIGKKNWKTKCLIVCSGKGKGQWEYSFCFSLS